MRIRTPSPALIISIVALVMATTGTAVAAVSFARNADMVDGKHAVFAGTSPAAAAGKLVTLNRSGASRGHFSTAYLPPFVGGKGAATSFGRGVEVPDNASGAAQGVVSIAGIGTLTVTCTDQNANPNIEDPVSIIGFVNQSGGVVNYARSTGTGQTSVTSTANGTVTNTQINGDNSFELVVQTGARSASIHGAARQDGRGSNAAFCTVWGTALQVGG